MATENIEVEVGKKPDKDPAPDKIGQSSSGKPPEKEVEGHHCGHIRYMRCWNCGHIIWVDYDIRRFHAYNCSICRAVNVF